MRMIIGNELEIIEPRDEIWLYAQKNLVLSNPNYIKIKRMGYWAGNTPKEFMLYTTIGDKLILPFGCLRDIVPYFKSEDRIVNTFKKADKVYLGNPIPLYNYQRIAVDEMVNECYGILQSKAGSGKTQMGIAIAQKIGARTLWLTHTHDLLVQSLDRITPYLDEKYIGTITEGKINIGESITFATIQTMANIDLDKYKEVWDTIIVDECHRVCGTPTALTQFYKVLSSLKARHKYGMSATVHRADGLIGATFALLGDVRYKVPDEAVSDKVMRVGIQMVDTPTTLTDDCLNPDGTLSYYYLMEHLISDRLRNDIIRDIIVDESANSILILSDRKKHLEDLYHLLPVSVRLRARIVTGDMTTNKQKALREEYLNEMREGKANILFATYKLAKEGLDIPRLNRLILATPQKDYAIVTQSIGRIARVFEGKEDAICFDIVDDISYLQKMYKKRRTSYNKAGCYYL